MLRKIGIFFLFLGLAISAFTAYSIWRSTLPLVSPLALIETMMGSSFASKSPKIVYGFFPYWNIKQSENLNISTLTHFAYFAIDLNPDGSINKVNADKEQEPGWNKLRSKATEKLLYQSKLLGQKTVITVTAMDTDLITEILNSPSNSLSAVSSVMDIYKEYKFDDINVDFEYVGEPSPQTRENFTDFVQSLKSACLAVNPSCRIDIDIFADTAQKYRLWDISALNPIVDRFIVMAYDYFRKTSKVAGPVAPITGMCKTFIQSGCLDQDINSHISQLSKIISAEKIILGVPFYGYQWQTASKDFLANTYPGTGATVPYERIQTYFSDPEISSLSAQWSKITLSPYLIFEKDEKIYQLHFEDAESLKQKIKLVKSAGLGGIAIWALGYETPYPDLWEVIAGLSSP